MEELHHIRVRLAPKASSQPSHHCILAEWNKSPVGQTKGWPTLVLAGILLQLRLGAQKKLFFFRLRVSTSFMKRRHSSSCHGKATHCTAMGIPTPPRKAFGMVRSHQSW